LSLFRFLRPALDIGAIDMTDFIPISEALSGKLSGKEVRMRGWIHSIRKQKEVAFIILRDSTGTIQVAIKEPAMVKQADQLTVESSLELTGTVSADKRAPGGFEIRATELTIVGLAERWPITRDKSEEFLREMRHLWIRDPKVAAVLKVRSHVFQAIRQFYTERGYWEFQAPSFTGASVEGGSTLFEVKYFDKKAYLTQSWQLYAEAGIFSLEKIFTIAPSFRAEKSRTIRHLAEYWHHEMEAAWMGYEELLKIQEEMLLFIADYVLKHARAELEMLGSDISRLEQLKAPFMRLPYAEMVKMLGKKWGDDITDKEERELVEKLGGKPVFLTHFPRDMKAFYMRPDPKDPKVVLAADLLLPGVGEVTGGSERIMDEKELLESLRMFKLKKADYDWYLDLRRFGSVPHSGYGLGIERLVMWLTGASHIFETIPFPRTMERLTP